MARSLLFAALLASPALVFADPPAGQIDPNFGSFDNGVLGLQLEGFNLSGDLFDAATAMTQDAQGRLLLAGVTQTDTGFCLGLMRFTPAGQLDTSDFGFNLNHVAKGKICHPVLTPGDYLGEDFDIAMLPDGGFFVGGYASTHPFVCRFHADGEKMDGFGNGTGCITLPQITTTSWPAPALLVHDASLLIVANHRPNMIGNPVLARVSIASGAIEPFGQQMFVPLLSSTADAFAWDATLTADGNVVAVGQIKVDPFDNDAFVARFDLQQTQPDLGFSGDGMARFKFNKGGSGADSATAMTLLPNGNILAAGDIEMADRHGIAVLQLDGKTGAAVQAFNGGVPKAYDPCVALPGGCDYFQIESIGQSSAHIVFSGGAGDDVMFAARLRLDGSVAPDFGLLVTTDIYSAKGMVLQGERIVLGGTADRGNEDLDYALLRLSDGRLFNDQFEVEAP